MEQLNGIGESLTSEEALSKFKLMEEEKGMKLMEKEANQYPSEFLLAA